MPGHIVSIPDNLPLTTTLRNLIRDDAEDLIAKIGGATKQGRQYVFKTALTDKQIQAFKDAGASVYENNAVRLIKPIETKDPFGAGLAPRSVVRPTNQDSQTAHGVKALHEQGITGKGVHMFVLDTGLHKGHIEFDGNRVKDFQDHTKDGRESVEDAADGQGHGTHVTATAAGNDGVAPGAFIHANKVLDDQGSGQLAWILAGLDEAIAYKQANPDEPVIVSMSLGGTASSENPLDDPMVAKVKEAHDLGIAVVLAAGNSGGQKEGDAFEGTVGTPAVAASVKAGYLAQSIAAMNLNKTPSDYTDDGRGYFSSNAAKNPNAPYGQGHAVTFGANGVNVRSAKAGTRDEYVTYSGTSMATPNTAGMNALLMDLALTEGYSGEVVNQMVRDGVFTQLLAWSAMGAKDAAALDEMSEVLGPIYDDLRQLAAQGVGELPGWQEGAGNLRVDLAAKLFRHWYGRGSQTDAPSQLFPPWFTEGEDSSAPNPSPPSPDLPIPALPIDWQEFVGGQKYELKELEY